jgi:hypothetical protein
MATATEVRSVSTKSEEGLLGWLDGPRVVVGAFAFFLLGMVILLILLWSDTNRLQAEHEAEALAAQKEQVGQCFATASQAPQLLLVLNALEREVSDPAARDALRNYRRLNSLNAPTLRECRQLAEELNVPIPKGVHP